MTERPTTEGRYGNVAIRDVEDLTPNAVFLRQAGAEKITPRTVFRAAIYAKVEKYEHIYGQGPVPTGEMEWSGIGDIRKTVKWGQSVFAVDFYNYPVPSNTNRYGISTLHEDEAFAEHILKTLAKGFYP